MTGLKVDDPVTFIAIQGCRSCEYCTGGYMQLCKQRRVQGLSYDGGMAEFVSVKWPFVKRVPRALPVTARALIEPTTIAAHCAKLLGDLRGKRIVLPGAGIIGILTALACRKAGAEVTVTGIEKDRDTRLKKAGELGFKTIVTGNGLPSLADQFRAMHGRAVRSCSWRSTSGRSKSSGRPRSCGGSVRSRRRTGRTRATTTGRFSC